MKLAIPAGSALLAVALLAIPARAQEEVVAGEQETPAGEPEPPSQKRFRIGGEVKVHFRDSQSEELRLNFPFPPELHPARPGRGVRAHGRGGQVVRALDRHAHRRGRAGRRRGRQGGGPLLGPVQPQPHQLGRPRLRAPGLGAAGRQVRVAAGAAGDDVLRTGRAGPPLLQAAHAAARELRAVGHRGRPLRAAAARGWAAASASTSTGAA